MTNIEILMMDGCTSSEAEKHLEMGTIIFEKKDFESNFCQYMNEWDIEEEDQEKYRKMITEKKPVTDWGIVEHNGNTWYISYCL